MIGEPVSGRSTPVRLVTQAIVCPVNNTAELHPIRLLAGTPGTRVSWYIDPLDHYSQSFHIQDSYKCIIQYVM